MRAVTVYRVDYARKTRYSVGVVLEQRRTERGNNYKDLLRLARSQFAFANSCRWPWQAIYPQSPTG